MDYSNLMRFLICKRKETTTLRGEMGEALKECVDPARMVLETVKEFLEAKKVGKRGMTDKRWACGVVVTGLFPPEELKGRNKERDCSGPAFGTKTVEEVEEVVRGWREKAEAAGDHDNDTRMGSAEVAMFMQVVVGFGLKDIFEEEFYKKAVMEFSGRRDMAKIAIPIFGDKIGGWSF